jgi:hypothetical protein
MRPMSQPATRRMVLIALLVGALVLLATPSIASVRLEGTWPDANTPVSLDAKGLPRSEAVRRLADALGWSVVLHVPSADLVDLHVKDQPAAKVLSMILADGSYVAKRDGDLIAIERDKAAPESATSTSEPVAATSTTPPAPPSPPAPSPVTTGSPPDRVVSGGRVRVEKGEVVHDVVVFGGSADILGTATGDVTVVGGSARVHKDAHVMGDATAVGGSLDVEDGARVDGDVGVVGGVLRRGEQAQIGGASTTDVSSDAHVSETEKDDSGSWFTRLVASIGRAIASAALLFVIGSVLLALAARRMDALQAELAARPMRSFALGVVGSIAFAALLVALLVSLVGIPVAFVGGLLAVIAGYAGVCAVLVVAGGALLRHRTPNPYVHLALGCTLFLVAKALPLVGHIVFFVVLLLGFGAIVGTRAAGLIPGRTKGT